MTQPPGPGPAPEHPAWPAGPPAYPSPPPGHIGPPPGAYYYRPAPLPQPLSPAGVPLADFGTRVLAYLIDTALLSAAIMVVALPVTFVVPFFHYLDGLWQLWDKPYLQTLHDKAARTVVVKVSP